MKTLRYKAVAVGLAVCMPYMAQAAMSARYQRSLAEKVSHDQKEEGLNGFERGLVRVRKKTQWYTGLPIGALSRGTNEMLERNRVRRESFNARTKEVFQQPAQPSNKNADLVSNDDLGPREDSIPVSAELEDDEPRILQMFETLPKSTEYKGHGPSFDEMSEARNAIAVDSQIAWLSDECQHYVTQALEHQKVVAQLHQELADQKNWLNHVVQDGAFLQEQLALARQTSQVDKQHIARLTMENSELRKNHLPHHVFQKLITSPSLSELQQARFDELCKQIGKDTVAHATNYWPATGSVREWTEDPQFMKTSPPGFVVLPGGSVLLSQHRSLNQLNSLLKAENEAWKKEGAALQKQVEELTRSNENFEKKLKFVQQPTFWNSITGQAIKSVPLVFGVHSMYKTARPWMPPMWFKLPTQAKYISFVALTSGLLYTAWETWRVSRRNKSQMADFVAFDE